MRTQLAIIIIILLLFMSLMDIYAYRGVSQLMQGYSLSRRFIISGGFWLLTFVMFTWFLWLGLTYKNQSYDQFYHNVTLFFGAMILVYIPKLFFNIFQIVHDIAGLIRMIASSPDVNADNVKITRAVFILQFGLIVSGLLFFSILWGIWKGKYNFKVRRLKLRFPGLPQAFQGIRLLQISDFHIGSFSRNPDEVKKAVDLINRENADYVFFTGDMINNIANELDKFKDILSGIKAQKGKYAILGNHDYGDYYQWDSKEARDDNLEKLCRGINEAGFRLLRNEAIELSENGESVALIGVENWGLPPFPQYGDLGKAMQEVKQIPFKILLSHDPSHWDAEVVSKQDISLTLSGHTHGMQFAIRIPGWSWSPVKMKYPRWNGLYREGAQYLYVNIGIGFIGFPGRVGTPPEIAVFELAR